MNSHYDEETQRNFYYAKGDKVVCRHGYLSHHDIDRREWSTFYPIQGETYTIESVEYCEDDATLYVSLVEDSDFSLDWCASRFVPASVFLQG